MGIRFKNKLVGFAISNTYDNVFTLDGGITWTRTDDSDTFDILPFDGYYRLIDGAHELYLAGTDGYIVKWK